MNISKEIEEIKLLGYSEENAVARFAQDLILYGIANSPLKNNVTIKGGVVMRNLSKDERRATQDIDFDLIRLSISNESIENFINSLKIDKDLKVEIKYPILELKHQDYKGKRVFITIKDNEGNSIDSKIDIGVHKDLDIKQDEYCFDICFDEKGANLLMNSKEQIITEKLKSFLRFGTRSTRYKDVFDINYLSDKINKTKLNQCIKKYIYDDNSLNVNNKEELKNRIQTVFENKQFINEIKKSNKNWLEKDIEEVLDSNINFINTKIV